MIAAHADEVCFTVKSIDEKGFLWLTSGWADRDQRPGLRSFMFLPWGQPALVQTAGGPVHGFFATLTGHILTPDQRAKPQFDWYDIWVDLGATSRAEAEAKGIRIGDRVIWNTKVQRMGDYAYGKAMDDRVGLAIMDRLLHTLDASRLAYDVTFVSTVQEETGLVGAESATLAGCELAISLDIGLAGDVPGVDQRDVSVKLGAGPTIVHKDIYVYNRRLTLALVEAAEAANIGTQQAVFSFYGSDSGAFTRRGLQAALITVPTRYTHSPFEMVHLDDVQNTVVLLKTFLESKN
jgi:endoglucanase